MLVSVLGPVRIIRDGAEVQLGPRLQRLLAALVVHRGSVVSSDALVDIVWDGGPPPSGDRTLRSHVTRLRHALSVEDDTIIFRQAGYALDLDADAIDADLFESEIDDAVFALRMADPALADDLLERALARWNGSPYSGFADDQWVRPERVRLEERRVEAIETHVEVMIADGRTEMAIALARSLVEEVPLSERPRALLMRAMYVGGRQAEALRVYRDYRHVLAEETGLDPSTDLSDLEGRIVRGELSQASSAHAVRGYELGECLGRGTFSIVHRAIQPGIGREVAVKVIRPDIADRPEFVRRFEVEAQLVARIEHPHVVPLYDFWREPRAAYLVMRWMRGGSLEELVRSRGPMSRQQVSLVLEQIGGALHATHRAGLVHRDVRPANLLRDDDGSTYLSDFGIAASTAIEIDDRLVHYAAPELLRGEPTDTTADILSVGVTTFELLTGRLPFADTPERPDLIRRQLTEPLPPVRATRADLSQRVDEILARATSKAAADRYPAVSDFVDDMIAALLPRSHRPAPELPAGMPNPYRGLHAFTEADADRFYGRDRLIGELVNHVEQHRLVTVVGPSGSGKSSVVRAGLIPALRRGAVTGSGDWFVTTMFPGVDPIGALETALLRVAVNPPASLREHLAEPGGLQRAVRRVLPDGNSTVLVVIDQFEELFTQVNSDETRERFLSEIAHALDSPESPLRIVATLRADHYDSPLRSASLADSVTRGTVTVRPMRADELESAIVLPAQSVGVEVEPGLVAELIAGVTTSPSALPLLQFALTELFERRVADVMSTETHASLGGLTGALAARAERILVDADDDDEAATRRIFGRLVGQRDDSRTDLRRRASLSEFGEDERTAWLLDAFVTARLLVLGRDDETREPTVEVAHEALLRDWPRLRGWLDDDRADLRQLQRIHQSAIAWEVSGHDDGELARGGRLEFAIELSERRFDLLNPSEQAWVSRSCDVAAAAEERERRRDRRLHRSLKFAAALAVVALAAASVAVVLRNQSVANEQLGQARQLVLEAEKLLVEDPELAALLAVESIRSFQAANGSVPADATDVLRLAIIEHRVVTAVPGGEFVDVSSDGSTMITSSDGGGVAVWDVEPLNLRNTIAMTDGRTVSWAWYAGDELQALVSDESQYDVVRHVGGSRWQPVVEGFAGPAPIPYAAFAGDGRWFAAVIDSKMRVWDTTGGASVDRPAWSADVADFAEVDVTADEQFAFADSDGVVHVVDAATGVDLRTIELPFFANQVSFSTDESRLAVMASDVAVVVYDLERGEVLWEPVEIPRGDVLRWADGDASLLVGGEAGVLEIDTATGEMRGEIGSLGATIFSLDGVQGTSLAFVAPTSGGETLLVDLGIVAGRDAVDHLSLPLAAGTMSIDADATRITAVGVDEAAVIDIATGRTTQYRRGLPFRVQAGARDVNFFTIPVMNLDGAYVASADEDGRSRLWSAATGEDLWVAPDGYDIRVVSNSGKRVVIHRDDSPGAPATTRLVSIDDGSEVVLDAGGAIVRGQFAPDDRFVVLTAYGDESPLVAWAVPSGERIGELVNREDRIGGQIDVSRDGTRIALGDLDGTLHLLDAEAALADVPWDARAEFTVAAARSFINPVVLSPDGTHIATVAKDEPVRIWNSLDGSPVAAVPVSTADAGVGFHPTEPWFYVADGNDVVVHTLDVEELLALAAADVTRELTDDECQRYLRQTCN